MKIHFASDHAGHGLRLALKAHAEARGLTVVDHGPETPDRVDYPDFANRLADAMTDAPDKERGVLVCGSGIGISIAANRHRHIRAALCSDVTDARLSRAHNDANVLVLGERTIGAQVALDCLDAFLNGAFEGGRHADRVVKLG